MQRQYIVRQACSVGNASGYQYYNENRGKYINALPPYCVYGSIESARVALTKAGVGEIVELTDEKIKR